MTVLLNSRQYSHSFELDLALSPEGVTKRIAEQSDEMEAKSDKEAWARLFRGYRGSKEYLHAINGKEIFIQRRSLWGNQAYGVRLWVALTSYGSKLAGRPALSPGWRGFWVLWFGGVSLAFIISVINIPGEIASGRKPQTDLLWILVPVGMLIAGYLFRRAESSSSKKEMKKIQEWLDDLFADAKANVGR